jgi:tetratricopeptide (TPR) repeat protein
MLDERHPLPSYTKKTAQLAKEILLSVRWGKPGIFWALYENTFLGAKAVSGLEADLIKKGQHIQHITPDVDNEKNIIDAIADNNNWDKTVFFIMHMGSKTDKNTYQLLDSQSAFFTNNRIRVVYWLSEKDFVSSVQNMPPYWFCQIKLTEFSDLPSLDYLFSIVIKKTWEKLSSLEETSEQKEYFEMPPLEDLFSLDIRRDKEGLTKRAHIFIKLGIFYYKQKKYDKASQFLDKANEIAEVLQDEQFSLEAELITALFLAKKEIYDSARWVKKKVSLISPERSSTWNAIGELYTLLFMFDESLSAYQAALDLDTNDPISWQGLGEVFLQIGQTTQAIDAFQKSIQFAPNFSYAWHGLGKSYLAKNDSEKAIEAYKQSLEIKYHQANLWFELGKLANDDLAQSALQHALELEQEKAPAWNLLGNIYYRSGKFNKAMQAYYRSVQIEKDFGWAYANIALIYSQRKEYENATLLYIKALQNIQDDQEKSNVLYKLGNAYRGLHKYRIAINTYNEANNLHTKSNFLDKKLQSPGPFEKKLDISPTSDFPKDDNKPEVEPASLPETSKPILINVNPKLKKGKNSMMLRKVLETNKKASKVEYWLELGDYYVRNHMHDLAEDAFVIAVDLDPNNGWSYYNLALARTVNGSYRDAVPLYEKSIHLFEKKKNKASSWNQLGNVYRRLNEPSLAVAAYEKARVLDPPKSSLLSRARLSLMSNCYAK